MSNCLDVVLVKDMLPKRIVQKGFQHESIENVVDMNNINSRYKFIDYLLFLDFYKRKNLEINDFYSNINREKFDGTIEEFYNSLTDEQLQNFKE